MFKWIAFCLVLGLALVAFPRSASAAGAILSPAVLCVPSLEQARGEVASFAHPCLLLLPPWLETTSFEFTSDISAQLIPQATPRRLGGRLQLKF